MEEALKCDCGFEARAEDEAELVVQVRRHASKTHGMALSDEEALLIVATARLPEPRRIDMRRWVS